MHKSTKSAIHLSKIVNRLGKILGLVIKEQEGINYYNKVEKIRILSKESRQWKNSKKNITKFNQLKSNILKLKPKESLVIARSFSQFLNFCNLAESLFSVHKMHNDNYNKTNVTNEFILLEESISRILKNKSISKNNFYKNSTKLKIDLVLTAHPTEVKRRTLIQKYTQLINTIENFNNLRIFNKKNNYREELSLQKSLYEKITSIWKTDEIKRSKPTPSEEAKWGLAVIEDSLWKAIPKICSRFDSAVYTYTGKHLPINFSPITFGSWIGGDRDGNPNVTAKTTQEVILLSRWEAANLFEKELTKLIQNLSMHECSKILTNIVGDSREPYRVFLRPIRNKMKTTQKEIELHLIEKKPLNESLLVQSIEEVIKPLNIVYDSLCSINCNVIANGLVLDILRQAHSFGINLAKLDIRQESKRHEKLINSICLKKNIGIYKDWSEEEKISFLIKELKSNKKLIPKNIKLDKEDTEVWSTFKMIANLPIECLGTYVVSMTSSVSDILSVLILQKSAGVKSYLSIVPLFETLYDLNNCHKVINKLYNIPKYLNIFQNNQQIMIGYSDSSKDAGNFAASWALYCAQEKLQNISDKYNVKLTLFHGRGGSVGRGGGPVYAALLSQPPGTVNGRTRITEQGEVIQQKYSTESLAEYSLGTYISSVLEATFNPPTKPKKNWRRLMNEMSKTATISYRQNLQRDDFLRYFNTITPQGILDKLYIGSRPSRRKNTSDIKNLRAIPWVFAWTQMRFILPSWLGTLEALEHASTGNNKNILKQMLNKWPFFYAMMDMLDMVLTKTDQRVINFYEECLGDSGLKFIGKQLQQQLSSLIKLNKKIIPQKILNQHRSYRQSIRVRNTYAETLNLLQADIMKKLNNKNISNKNKKILLDAMLVTIAGISAAMKNTG